LRAPQFRECRRRPLWPLCDGAIIREPLSDDGPRLAPFGGLGINTTGREMPVTTRQKREKLVIVNIRPFQGRNPWFVVRSRFQG